MKKYLLTGVLTTALIIPSLGYAVPPASKNEVAHPAPRHGHRAMPRHGRHHPPMPLHGSRRHIMNVSQRLAAMETAIGIRTDQLDVWRNYTSAFTDMVRMEPPSVPTVKELPAASRPLFGERMADNIIARVDKANAFKKAAEELRKVLDEKQLDRMAAFSRQPHERPDERASTLQHDEVDREGE